MNTVLNINKTRTACVVFGALSRQSYQYIYKTHKHYFSYLQKHPNEDIIWTISHTGSLSFRNITFFCSSIIFLLSSGFFLCLFFISFCSFYYFLLYNVISFHSKLKKKITVIFNLILLQKIHQLLHFKFH